MKKFALAMLISAAGSAHAQVIINEAFENPPGSDDGLWEYLEIHGPAGMSLDGYVIGLVKGGADLNGDNIPERPSEIDECFTLQGRVIGSNGFFVLYNDTDGGSFLIDLIHPDSGRASFTEAHIPTSDTPGKLSNDDSSTYVLLRHPPVDDAFGTSWRKDIDPDQDWNSRLDFGSPFQPIGFHVDPYQMVDDFAWSNNAGKEYVRDSQDELTETIGYNPDAVSRLAYYGENPGPQPRRADEEWVRGDLISLDDLQFNPARSNGPTGASLADFRLTPGTFNDTSGNIQRRFVAADITFDGRVTLDDYCLAISLVGASLDDTELVDDDNNTPDDESDDFTYTGWTWQGREFNALHVLVRLNLADGGGPVATTADLAVLRGFVCFGDWDQSGTLNVFDFLAFQTSFSEGDPCADVTGEGSLNVFDFLAFQTAFSEGC